MQTRSPARAGSHIMRTQIKQTDESAAHALEPEGFRPGLSEPASKTERPEFDASEKNDGAKTDASSYLTNPGLRASGAEPPEVAVKSKGRSGHSSRSIARLRRAGLEVELCEEINRLERGIKRRAPQITAPKERYAERRFWRLGAHLAPARPTGIRTRARASSPVRFCEMSGGQPLVEGSAILRVLGGERSAADQISAVSLAERDGGTPPERGPAPPGCDDRGRRKRGPIPVGSSRIPAQTEKVKFLFRIAPLRRAAWRPVCKTIGADDLSFAFHEEMVADFIERIGAATGVIGGFESPG